MKKILFSLLILGLSMPALAQQRSTLRGRIVDLATGEPLFGATVLVDSTKNGLVGESGAFTVTDIPRGEALVEVFYVGYETVSRRVDFNRASVDFGTVGLREVENAIGAVSVTANANPVIQMGDTTQFNAAAFRTNPDADAIDLVAKMPGMEVSESGITAQGEAVARVYVNNELFFGDDATTALNNLPADLVESIQMFDELPDDTRFSGFNDGRTQRALNIVTKNKFNRTVDLRLEAGYGQELQRDVDGKYQPRYDIGGRLNVLSSTTSLNVNGIMNNVNSMGGGRGGFGGGGFGGSGGLRTLQRIGGNYTVKIDSLSRLNVEYSYNANKSRGNSLTINNYYPTDFFDSRLTRDTLSSHSASGSHSVSSRYDFEGTRDRIRAQVRASLSDDSSDSFRLGTEWRNGSDYSLSERLYESEGGSYRINGSVDWQHRLGQKAGRTFSINGNFSLSRNTSDNIEDTDLTKFYEGETDPTKIYWASDAVSFSRSFGLSFNYNEPLSDKMSLNFNYRPSYNYSSSERIRVDQFGAMDSLVSERFTYDYLLHTGRVGLSFNKQNHFNFSVSMSAQLADRAQTMTLPRDFEMDRSFTSLLPTFSFRYFVQRTKYFQINYNTSSRLPSLEQLSTVIDISDPIRYSVGNANLKQDYSHSLNFRYNANNLEHSTNFYANLSGSLTTNNIASQTIYFTENTMLPEYGDFVFGGGTNLTRPMNAGNSATLSAGAGYGFVFRPLKLNMNLMGNYSYSHTPSYVGQTLTTSNNNNAMLGLFINSNISQNVDFTVGTFANYGTTDNAFSPNKETWGENTFVQANFIFLGGFVFNTNYSINVNSTLDKPYHVWSAYLGRKFLRNNAAEFRIEFNDILNQARSYSYTYGPQMETEAWNRVMGRYVMARITYRFNSLRSGQTAQQGGRGGRDGEFGPPGGGEFRPGGDGGFSPGGGGGFSPGGGGGGGRPMGPPPGGF